MKPTRREALAAIGTAGILAGTRSAVAQLPRDRAAAEDRITHGKIRQSVMGWCFKPMTAVTLARHCRDIGLVAIEGISAKDYPAVKELGLQISLVGSHGFKKGPVNRDNHGFCAQRMKDGIDLAVEVGCRNVITFTGMREGDIDHEQGARNCIDCWKSVIGYAEKQKINLCLEHLNSRDDTHPMKGHPGYFGDDVDFCVELIRQVGSPNMKLLFDIYHVQIMNGDVIRRIRQYQNLIGHYHTAGNPGRGELDERQEINYPAVMRAILETGYTGFVAQEFIPTWDDPVLALRHAAKVCDVTA
jgi:hydroxypyruvate isomerase